jgi:hypothetical protein
VRGPERVGAGVADGDDETVEPVGVGFASAGGEQALVKTTAATSARRRRCTLI